MFSIKFAKSVMNLKPNCCMYGTNQAILMKYNQLVEFKMLIVFKHLWFLRAQLELVTLIFNGITCRVPTSFWSWNYVNICWVASKGVLEVTDPWDFFKCEGITSRSSWAGVLAMPGWWTSKAIDNIVAMSVSEIIKAVVWNGIKC